MSVHAVTKESFLSNTFLANNYYKDSYEEIDNSKFIRFVYKKNQKDRIIKTYKDGEDLEAFYDSLDDLDIFTYKIFNDSSKGKYISKHDDYKMRINSKDLFIILTERKNNKTKDDIFLNNGTKFKLYFVI